MKYFDLESMPLVLDVADICDTLSIGRSKGYELIKAGRIPAIRIGTCFRIPRDGGKNYAGSHGYSNPGDQTD